MKTISLLEFLTGRVLGTFVEQKESHPKVVSKSDPKAPIDATVVVPPMLPRDHDHLRMLAIFHYLAAGMNGLGALFGIMYVGFGSFISSGVLNGLGGAGAGPPAQMGWFFIGIGAFIVVFAMASTALTIAAAVNLQNGTRKWLCITASVFHCLQVPIGTLLGAFTLVALSKPAIKGFFEKAKPNA